MIAIEDAERFHAGLETIVRVFRAAVSSKERDDFWEIMRQDCSIEVWDVIVQLAIRQRFKTATGFPLPADLLDLLPRAGQLLQEQRAAAMYARGLPMRTETEDEFSLEQVRALLQSTGLLEAVPLSTTGERVEGLHGEMLYDSGMTPQAVRARKALLRRQAMEVKAQEEARQ